MVTLSELEHIAQMTREVGALCFSRGEQRFSAAEKSWTSMMRFSAGLEIQG